MTETVHSLVDGIYLFESVYILYILYYCMFLFMSADDKVDNDDCLLQLATITFQSENERK